MRRSMIYWRIFWTRLGYRVCNARSKARKKSHGKAFLSPSLQQLEAREDIGSMLFAPIMVGGALGAALGAVFSAFQNQALVGQAFPQAGIDDETLGALAQHQASEISGEVSSLGEHFSDLLIEGDYDSDNLLDSSAPRFDFQDATGGASGSVGSGIGESGGGGSGGGGAGSSASIESTVGSFGESIGSSLNSDIDGGGGGGGGGSGSSDEDSSGDGDSDSDANLDPSTVAGASGNQGVSTAPNASNSGTSGVDSQLQDPAISSNVGQSASSQETTSGNGSTGNAVGGAVFQRLVATAFGGDTASAVSVDGGVIVRAIQSESQVNLAKDLRADLAMTTPSISATSNLVPTDFAQVDDQRLVTTFAQSLQSRLDSTRSEGVASSTTDDKLDLSKEALQQAVAESLRDMYVDGNVDGVSDLTQSHVQTFFYSDSAPVTLVAPLGTQLITTPPVDLPSEARSPAGVEFPLGVFDYSIHEVPLGASATVEIVLPKEVDIDGYAIFGPTHDNPVPHWYDFTYDGTTGAQILDDRIVVHFVDGMRGDDDLMVNGVIVDPGAPTTSVPDSAYPVLTLSTDTIASAEEGASTVIRVRREGSLAESVEAFVALTGTAQPNVDYAIPSASNGTEPYVRKVHFEPGVAEVTLAVQALDDSIPESDETIVAQLTYPKVASENDWEAGAAVASTDELVLAELWGYEIGLASTAVATIGSSDTSFIVSIQSTDAKMSEEADDTATFVVSRTGSTDSSLSVEVSLSGAATLGEDYSSSTFGENNVTTVTIPAGQLSTTITLQGVRDADTESDESVELRVANSNSYVVGRAMAWASIRDRNGAPTVWIEAVDNVASEDGNNSGKYRIHRTGNTWQPLSVAYQVYGTAQEGLDYEPFDGGFASYPDYRYGYMYAQNKSITIPSGQSFVDIDLNPIADGWPEGPETVSLRLVSPFSHGYYGFYSNYYYDYHDLSNNEGNFGYYESGVESSINSLSYNPYWYYRPSYAYGSLNWGGSSWRGVNAYTIGVQSTATATIIDSSTQVSIIATDAIASELDGDKGEFRISRTGKTSSPLTVFYQVYGSAMQGVDYAALNAETSSWSSIEIPVGSSHVDLSISPLTDDLVEGTESVIVALRAGVGSWQAGRRVQAYSIGSARTAQVQIVDAAPTVSVVASDPDASEAGGDTGRYTITRTGSTAQSLTVRFSVMGNAYMGIDYESFPNMSGDWFSSSNYAQFPGGYLRYGTITIPAKETSATIDVRPIDDDFVEGTENVVLRLVSDTGYNWGGDGFDYYAPSYGWNASKYIVGAPSQATVKITDDDIEPIVTIQATSPIAYEEGPTPGRFQVTRTGSTFSSLTVPYIVSGTAVYGMDYQSLPNPGYGYYRGYVEIPAGKSFVQFDIVPIDDATVEGTETVTISLEDDAGSGGYYMYGYPTGFSSQPYQLGAPSSATVEIREGDVATSVHVIATDNAASEANNNSGTFTFYRSGGISSSLTVFYQVSGTANFGGSYSYSSIDYSGLASFNSYYAMGSVTFAPGANTVTMPVVPINDTQQESDETVVVTVSSYGYYMMNPGQTVNYVVGDPSSATVTIADDDGANVVRIETIDNLATEQGPTTGTFRIVRTGSVSAPLTIPYSVSGTATANINLQDYTGITGLNTSTMKGSVTIPSGESFVTFTILPIDDLRDEQDESVIVTLDPPASSTTDTGTGSSEWMIGYSPGGPGYPGGYGSGPTGGSSSSYTLGTPTSGTVTIVDNDDFPFLTLEATDAVAKEGESDNAAFRLTRTGDLTNALSVTVGYSGTTSSEDYAFVPTTIVIPAGSSQVSWSIVPIDDTLVEGSETVVVTMTVPANHQSTGSLYAQASILDNDSELTVIREQDARESTLAQGRFRINRQGAIQNSLTVSFALTGTANEMLDYASVLKTVTFPANVTTAVVAISPVNDTESEPSETVQLTLNAQSNIQLVVPSASLTLWDDDTIVRVSAEDNTASESVNDTGSFRLTRTGSRVDFPIDIAVSWSGSATSGIDYTNPGNTFTIPENQSFVLIPIQPIDDNVGESTETVSINVLTTQTSGFVAGFPSGATINILDNEPLVSLRALRDASESGQVGTFEVRRTGGDLTQSLTVTMALGNGSATNGADFESLPTSITIPANESTATISVTAIDDAIAEVSETVWLQLTAGNLAPYGLDHFNGISRWISILDNEPLVNIARIQDSNEGGSSGIFRVERVGGNTNQDLTVALQITPSAAPAALVGVDYPSVPSTIIIPAGQTTADISILAIDDALAEGPENLSLSVVSTGSTPAYLPGPQSRANMQILDNEPTVSIQRVSDAKEQGLVAGQFAVTRTGGSLANALTVSYQVVSNGWNNATADIDYANLSGSVTIPAGQASTTFDVVPIQDSLPETTETVRISLVANTPATYLVDRWRSTDSLSLVDNDTRISLRVADGTANERFRSTGHWVVERFGGDTSLSLIVSTAVSGSATVGEDFDNIPDRVLIPAGMTSTVVSLSPIDDNSVEPLETVTLTLPSSPDYELGPIATGQIEIVDNDTRVWIEAMDSEASEEGQQPAVVRIQRGGENTAFPITVRLGTSGSAWAGTDYTGFPSNQQITFDAGQSSIDLTMVPIDDLIGELEESAQIRLVDGDYAVTPTSNATFTITDNEPVIEVDVVDGDAAEQDLDTGTWRIRRTGGSMSQPLTVHYDFLWGGAVRGSDFQALAGPITFNANQTEVLVTLTPIDDNVGELEENAILYLSSASGYRIGTSQQGAIRILDNEPTVSVLASDSIASEDADDQAGFTIVRQGGLQINNPLTVRYTLAGTASNGTDYESLTGEVTILAGQSSAIVNVIPIDDLRGEPEESVVLTLLTAPGYRVDTPSFDSIAILDNEPVVSIEAVADAREQDAVAGRFRIRRVGNTTNSLEVKIASQFSQATQGVDFVPLPASVTIPAGASEQEFSVMPLDDAVGEASERIQVGIVADVIYQIESTASLSFVQLIDNDAIVSLSSSGTSASESNLAGLLVQVTRQFGDTSKPLVVRYETEGTATANADYQRLTGQLVIPAGALSSRIQIIPFDDDDEESNETIVIQLTPGDYAMGAENVFQVGLVDDDTIVSVETTLTNISEAAGTVPAFVFKRTGDALSPLPISFHISGSATSQDYSAIPSTFTIPAGEWSATLPITLLDDDIGEASESLSLRILSQNLQPYKTSSQHTAQFMIDDNEPVLSISSSPIFLLEDSNTAASFTVSREGGNLQQDLDFAMQFYGSATRNSDYRIVQQRFFFPAGESTATFTIEAMNDSLGEGIESVGVLLAAGNYRIGSSSLLQVTILDDEPIVTLSVVDREGSESDNSLVYRLTRSGENSQPLVVNVQGVTGWGSATPGMDYQVLPSYTIPSGQDSIDFTVVPIDDSIPENSENVLLQLLSGPYQLGQVISNPGIIHDNEPVVRFATNTVRVTEGASSASITLTRAGGDTQTELQIAYTVLGTAQSGTDYVALPGTYTFAAGQLTGTVLVVPNQDILSESEEQITVTLQSSSRYSIANANATTTVSILDDDPTVTLRSKVSSIPESTFHYAQFVEIHMFGAGFELRRTGGDLSQPLRVNYTIGGSATPNVDYSALRGTAQFLAGSATLQLPISPLDDLNVESQESIQLTLLPDGYNVGGNATATLLVNDDEQSVEVTSMRTLSETGGSNMVFTFQRKGDLSAPMVLPFAVSGTATSGVDYVLGVPLIQGRGEVTIPAGANTVTVTGSVVADSIVESNETASLEIQAGNYLIGKNRTATTNIIDSSATVTISSSDLVLREEGLDGGLITATRSGSLAQPLTVPLNYQLFSATPGRDFIAPTSITIPAGSESATISIAPIQDLIPELDESIVVFPASSVHYRVSPGSMITLTLEDNEPRVSIVAKQPSVLEGSGNATWRIQRTGATSQSLPVRYNLESWSAIAGLDFQRPSGIAVIPAGADYVDINVPVFNDSNVEQSEEIRLGLRQSPLYSISTTQRTAAILLEDDEPTLGIEATIREAMEGGALQAIVYRQGDTSEPIEVRYSISGSAVSDADFSTATGLVTIPAGQANATIDFSVLHDELQEGVESISLTLQATSSYRVSGGASREAAMTILDSGPIVFAEPEDMRMSEEEHDTATVNLFRTGDVTGPLTALYQLQGTAATFLDYSGAPADYYGAVTFAAGSSTASIQFQPVRDQIPENDESFQFRLVPNSTYSSSPEWYSGSITDFSSSAIVPPVMANVRVETVQSTVNENSFSNSAFRITRVGSTNAPLFLTYTVAGTATPNNDYAMLPGTLVIPVGVSQVELPLIPFEDNVSEGNETISLTIGNHASYEILASSATATIVDINRSSLPEVVVSVQNSNVAEGRSLPWLGVSRRGPISDALPLTLSWTGNARYGQDFTISGSGFVLDAATENQGTFTLVANQQDAVLRWTSLTDAAAEAFESVQWTIAGNAMISTSQHNRSTSIGDMAMQLSIETERLSVSESEQEARFVIRRRGGDMASPASIAISYSGSAQALSDFLPSTTDVTFPAYSDEAFFVVPLVNDTSVEIAETLQVMAKSPSGTTIQQSISILDDEPVVSVSASIPATGETTGESGEFQFVRTGSDFSQPLMVRYSIIQDNFAFNAEPEFDFTGLSGIVTIPAGEYSAYVSVNPINDLIGEQSELVRIQLMPGDYAIGASQRADVVIADDESLVKITAQSPSIEEGGAVTFRVTRSADNVQSPFLVPLQFYSDGIAGTDHSPVPQSVTIPSGQLSATFTLQSFQDTLVEPKEIVTVYVSNGPFKIDQPSAASVTIVDDEPTVSLSVIQHAVEAGPAGLLRIERSGSTSSPLDVELELTGTAFEGVDFTSVPRVVTIPAAQSQTQISIHALLDAWTEGIEYVQFAAATRPTYISGSSATVWIQNVTPTISWQSTSLFINEGESAILQAVRTHRIDSPVTARYRVSEAWGNTAKLGSDVAILSGEVTFAAGQSTANISVQALQDNLAEPLERLYLQWDFSADYAFVNQMVWLNIVDNGPVVSISTVDRNATEGSTDTLTFRASRTGDLSQELIVPLVYSGTARNQMDYHGAISSITIPAGASSASWTQTADVDTLRESPETIIVSPAPRDYYHLGSSAIGSIQDLDTRPNVRIFRSSALTLSEGATDAAEFRVTRDGPLDQAMRVRYASNSIGIDWTGLSGEVTIPAGANEAIISVNPIDDLVAESSESLQITLVETQDYRLSNPSFASVTLTDDEPVISMTTLATSLTEGQAGNAVVQFHSSKPITTRPIYVRYANSGNLPATMDLVGVGADIGHLTLPIGSSLVERTISAVDDLWSEGNESIALRPVPTTSYHAVSTPVTLTVVDNEPTLLLEVLTPIVDESAGPIATHRITRSVISSEPLEVFLATANPIANFNADFSTPNSVTIPANQASVEVSTLIREDVIAEQNETLSVQIANDMRYRNSTSSTSTISISDNEPFVSIATIDGNAMEGTANSSVVFRVMRSGSTEGQLRVRLSLDGEVNPKDDLLSVPEFVDIPAGSAYVDVELQTKDDNRPERGESLRMEVMPHLPRRYKIEANQNQASARIIDDQTTTFIERISNPDEFQSNPGVFRVYRTGPVTQALTVQYAVSGTASPVIDYLPLPGSITIPVGSEYADIQLVPVEDSDLETAEWIGVTLETAGSGEGEGGSGGQSAGSRSARMMIQDASLGSWTSINEGSGSGSQVTIARPRQALSGDNQQTGVHGAYLRLRSRETISIGFKVDLSTWDSYEDLFSVSITDKPYDQIPKHERKSAAQWQWHGASYTDGVIDKKEGYYSITVTGYENKPAYLNVVVDTETNYACHTYYPSWGNVEVFLIDLDVDTSNKKKMDTPERTQQEDDDEEKRDNKQKPGKVVFVNNDDNDLDEIPDFLDGYKLNASEPKYGNASPDEKFVPVVFQMDLPDDVDMQDVKVRFEYSASPPKNATLEEGPAAGHLRLWTKNGSVLRSSDSVTQNNDPNLGYFVPANTTFSGQDLEKLGITDPNQTITLYAEGINTSDKFGDQAIKAIVEVDDAKVEDIVRLTIVEGFMSTPPETNADNLPTTAHFGVSPVSDLEVIPALKAAWGGDPTVKFVQELETNGSFGQPTILNKNLTENSGEAVVFVQQPTLGTDSEDGKINRYRYKVEFEHLRYAEQVTQRPGVPDSIDVQTTQIDPVTFGGRDKKQVTITVKDKNQNPVAKGTQVTWFGNDSATITAPSETDVHGQAIAELVSRWAVLPSTIPVEAYAVAGSVVKPLTIHQTMLQSSMDQVGNDMVVTTNAKDGSRVEVLFPPVIIGSPTGAPPIVVPEKIVEAVVTNGKATVAIPAETLSRGGPVTVIASVDGGETITKLVEMQAIRSADDSFNVRIINNVIIQLPANTPAYTYPTNEYSESVPGGEGALDLDGDGQQDHESGFTAPQVVNKTVAYPRAAVFDIQGAPGTQYYVKDLSGLIDLSFNVWAWPIPGRGYWVELPPLPPGSPLGALSSIRVTASDAGTVNGLISANIEVTPFYVLPFPAPPPVTLIPLVMYGVKPADVKKWEAANLLYDVVVSFLGGDPETVAGMGANFAGGILIVGDVGALVKNIYRLIGFSPKSPNALESLLSVAGLATEIAVAYGEIPDAFITAARVTVAAIGTYPLAEYLAMDILHEAWQLYKFLKPAEAEALTILMKKFKDAGYDVEKFVGELEEEDDPNNPMGMQAPGGTYFVAAMMAGGPKMSAALENLINVLKNAKVRSWMKQVVKTVADYKAIKKIDKLLDGNLIKGITKAFDNVDGNPAMIKAVQNLMGALSHKQFGKKIVKQLQNLDAAKQAKAIEELAMIAKHSEIDAHTLAKIFGDFPNNMPHWPFDEMVEGFAKVTEDVAKGSYLSHLKGAFGQIGGNGPWAARRGYYYEIFAASKLKADGHEIVSIGLSFGGKEVQQFGKVKGTDLDIVTKKNGVTEIWQAKSSTKAFAKDYKLEEGTAKWIKSAQESAASWIASAKAYAKHAGWTNAKIRYVYPDSNLPAKVATKIEDLGATIVTKGPL